MTRGRVSAWGSVAVLTLLAAGAVTFSLLEQPGSPSARLNAALDSTYDSSGYVSVSSSDPAEQDVVNSPDLYERIVHGTITEIWSGTAIYTATPARCSKRFVERIPAGSATTRFSGFSGDEVSVASGGAYVVSKAGREIGRYVVEHGYVVRTTEYFTVGFASDPAILRGVPSDVRQQLREAVERAERSSPRAVTITFTDIGHAPKISVPSQSEVTESPTLYLGECPV